MKELLKIYVVHTTTGEYSFFDGDTFEKITDTPEYWPNDDTVIAAVEARTSSPIRIIRDDNFESNIKGIYPIGEGAGYAGGITSAAVDGIKTFEKITDTPEYWLNEAKEVLKELFSNRRVVFGHVTLDFICEKLKSQMA